MITPITNSIKKLGVNTQPFNRNNLDTRKSAQLYGAGLVKTLTDPKNQIMQTNAQMQHKPGIYQNQGPGIKQALLGG